MDTKNTHMENKKMPQLKQIKTKIMPYNNKPLYLENAELNQIFEEIRTWDNRITHPTKTLTEQLKSTDIYLQISGIEHRAKAVKVTPEFIDWMLNSEHYYFNDLHLHFELVRQSSYNHTTKESTYLNKWLLLYSYSEIISSNWLNYYTHEQIQEFFGLDIR